MERFVVTFARGFGSGGKEIASILAKDLGIHCYENRILTLASQMSGLDEKLFQEVNEKCRAYEVCGYCSKCNTVYRHFQHDNKEKVEDNIYYTRNEEAYQRSSGISTASENRRCKVVKQYHGHTCYVHTEVEKCHIENVFGDGHKAEYRL